MTLSIKKNKGPKHVKNKIKDQNTFFIKDKEPKIYLSQLFNILPNTI